MYLVSTRSADYKTRTLKEARHYLELAGISDLGGMNREIRRRGAWFNYGELCGVEKSDGRSLRDVPFAPF